MFARTMGAILLPLILTATGCAGSTQKAERQVDADYPVYDSIEDLAAGASLVATVKVGKILSREMDDGGSGDPEDGVPMTMWSADLLDVVAGAPESGSIVIAWPDLEKDTTLDRSALSPGETLVVFLVRLTTKDAPGIDTQDTFYVPRGGDNGVLDVVGDTATARSPSLVSASDENQSETDGPLSLGLAELRSAVVGSQ